MVGRPKIQHYKKDLSRFLIHAAREERTLIPFPFSGLGAVSNISFRHTKIPHGKTRCQRPRELRPTRNEWRLFIPGGFTSRTKRYTLHRCCTTFTAEFGISPNFTASIFWFSHTDGGSSLPTVRIWVKRQRISRSNLLGPRSLSPGRVTQKEKRQQQPHFSTHRSELYWARARAAAPAGWCSGCDFHLQQRLALLLLSQSGKRAVGVNGCYLLRS